jgi:CheY-like chemotaxis protein
VVEILKGKTLLIVEDEIDLREPLVMEFESLGCKVLEAKNGKEGFEVLKREKIDAVISDIRMPGGDGIELLKNIKSLNHVFPVVMLITGFADLTREDAYDLGAEAILSKPFDLDEIGLAVSRILTPKTELWSQPPTSEKVNIKIERAFTELAQAIESEQIGIGRGGLFVAESEKRTISGAKVLFQVVFSKGDVLLIEGSGVIRWIRQDIASGLKQGFGIEFESLTKETQNQIIEYTTRCQVVPFIPKK